MSRKRQEEEELARREQRQKNVRRVILCGVFLLALVALFTGIFFISRPEPVSAAINSDGNLAISKDRLVEDKVLYISHPALYTDLIVWMNGDEVCTAFDTCEDCYSSGYVHYRRDGSRLICSNCGQDFPLASLGTGSWGSCQPVAIPTYYRLDTESELVIPAALLEYAEDMFNTWLGGDYSVSLSGYEPQ